MSKIARPDHPINDLLIERWSPYVLAERPVEADKIRRCLEAARWAASSYNEQPWRFIIAVRQDAPAEFEKMLGCLVEANQAWAKRAPVLMLTLAKKTFTQSGKPNRVREHDLGLAAAHLTFQATALDLYVHQMAGIDPAKIRATYHVPDDFEPVTAIALGYLGRPDEAPELADRDRQPRTRRPLDEWVFGGDFGTASPVVSESAS